MSKRGFWSLVCRSQFFLLFELAVCVAFLVLSLFSYLVAEESTSGYTIAQVNLVLLSLFIPAIVYSLYVCNRR